MALRWSPAGQPSPSPQPDSAGAHQLSPVHSRVPPALSCTQQLSAPAQSANNPATTSHQALSSADRLHPASPWPSPAPAGRPWPRGWWHTPARPRSPAPGHPRPQPGRTQGGIGGTLLARARGKPSHHATPNGLGDHITRLPNGVGLGCPRTTGGDSALAVSDGGGLGGVCCGRSCELQ